MEYKRLYDFEFELDKSELFNLRLAFYIFYDSRIQNDTITNLRKILDQSIDTNAKTLIINFKMLIILKNMFLLIIKPSKYNQSDSKMYSKYIDGIKMTGNDFCNIIKKYNKKGKNLWN